MHRWNGTLDLDVKVFELSSAVKGNQCKFLRRLISRHI